MAETAEVRVKLVFDKGAADATKAVTGDLKKLGDEAKTVGVETGKASKNASKGFGDDLRKAVTPATSGMKNLTSAATLAKGAFLAVGAGAIVGLGAVAAASYAASSAAFERAERVKAVTASLISLSGNKNISYGTANEAAKAYERDFRRIGVAAGVASTDVSKAFAVVAAQTNNQGAAWGQVGGKARLTLADAEKIAGNMAHASRLIPGGMGQLTAEYEALKGGMVDSQSGIVQMMTATGVLKGDAVEVTRQLASKDTITRMKLAEEAMKRTAKASRDIPMGWEGMKTSFAGIKDGFMSAMGEPIINKLMPHLNKIRDFFENNQEKLEAIADKWGGRIGGVIDKAGDIVASFGGALESSGFANAIEGAWAYVEDVFGWIYRNKDALAATFKDVFGVILSALEAAYSTLKSVADFLVVKVPKKGDVAEKELKNMNDAAANPLVGKAGKDVALAEFVNAQTAIMKATGDQRSNLEIEKEILAQYGAGKGGFAAQSEKSLAVRNNFDKTAQGANAGGDDALSAGAQFANLYSIAAKSHNEAAQQYAINLLKGNKNLQDALLKAGVDIEGGLMDVARKVGNADFSKAAAQAVKDKAGTGAVKPQITFNGATFNIKQDFRDQDPDRVAVVFRSDIMKAAQYRTSSGLSQPFGT